MPWDLLISCAVYSFIATSWRSEARQPGGIPPAWFIAGTASVGSIVLLLLIGFRISWWVALLCILASFVGQILLIPLDRVARSVVGLWLGVMFLAAAGTYIIYRVFAP